MSTQEITSNRDQYTLWQILGIWSLAAIPMRISSWIVYPAAARGVDPDPLGSGAARILLLSVALTWLLVPSLLSVLRGEGDLRRQVRQMGWGATDMIFRFDHLHQHGGHGIQPDSPAICFDRQTLSL